MDIKAKEALIAEINCFKEEALKMHIVQVLADSYTNTSLFDYNIDSDGSVIWYKAQARHLWDFWQAAKAQAVPEVLKKFCNEHKDPAWRGRLTEYDKGYSDCCIAVLEMIEAQEQAND